MPDFHFLNYYEKQLYNHADNIFEGTVVHCASLVMHYMPALVIGSAWQLSLESEIAHRVIVFKVSGA